MKFIILTQYVVRYNSETRQKEETFIQSGVNVSAISTFYAEETGSGKIKTRVCFDADNHRYVNETPEQIMELVNA